MIIKKSNKTKNGYTIKMSKKDWLNIGKKAGWVKESRTREEQQRIDDQYRDFQLKRKPKKMMFQENETDYWKNPMESQIPIEKDLPNRIKFGPSPPLDLKKLKEADPPGGGEAFQQYIRDNKWETVEEKAPGRKRQIGRNRADQRSNEGQEGAQGDETRWYEEHSK